MGVRAVGDMPWLKRALAFQEVLGVGAITVKESHS